MNAKSFRIRFALPALAAGILLASPGEARQEEGAPSCHGPGTASPAAERVASPRLRVPDLELLDQDGRTIRFYSDLVRDRVVAMNFIFTTCTTVCPPMGANFSRLQDALGERLGRDVQLVSVSIDPTTDTPQRLKAWGEKFSASDSWSFVTGPKADVDQVLRQLEVLSPDVKDHGPVVLLVNDRTGVWRRVNGLTPPAKLAAMLDELLIEEHPNSEEAAR